MQAWLPKRVASQTEGGVVFSQEHMSLPLIGLGLCWTWRAISSPLAIGGATSLVALVLACCLFFLLRVRLESPRFFCGVASFACVIGTVGVGMLITLAENGTEPGMATVVASLLVFFSSSLCVLLWIGPFARHSMRVMGLGLGAAYLAGSAAYFALSVLPLQATQGAAITIPVITCLLMVFDMPKADRVGGSPVPVAAIRSCADSPAQQGGTYAPEDAAGSISLIPWRTVLVVAVFNIAAGVNRFQTVVHGDVLAMGVAGLLMLVVTWVFSNKHSMYLIYRAFLPIMMAGLLAGLVLGRESAVAQGCINASYAISNAVLMLYVCDAARRFGRSPFGMYAFARLVTQLCFIGAVSMMAALPTAAISPGFDVVELIYAVALFAVALAVMFWLTGASPKSYMEEDRGLAEAEIDTEPPRAAVESGAPKTVTIPIVPEGPSSPNDLLGDIIERRCAELVEEYRLSERERDILVQLAWGKGVKRIEEELVISASTVKTHIRHIYAKAGIHTRAELEALLGIGAR